MHTGAAGAQNLDDIINQLPAIAQSGIARLAEAEWKKLPAAELDCVEQRLRERGDSMASFARRGIFPFDSRASEIRSQCRAGSTTRAAEQSSAQPKHYNVEGVAVGSRMKLDSASYREYKCSPSEQFEGLTWCQRARSDRERRGTVATTYSMLHGHDGSVVYVNRIQDPAFVPAKEAEREIALYSRRIGEQARVTRMPHRAGRPDGMIAVWGAATLEPLDAGSIRTLAEGRSPKKGLLIDYLGNFSRSAKEGLPVYRIGGGAGFVWAASFDQDGRGTLRFAAVDASALPSRLPAQPDEPVSARSQDAVADASQQSVPMLAQQADPAETNLAERKQPVETQRTEQKPDLAGSTDRIVPIEKADAQPGMPSALDAAHPAGAPERAAPADATPPPSAPDPAVAQLEADNAALRAESRRWEMAAGAAMSGLIALLMVLGLAQWRRWRRAARARRELLKAAAAPTLIGARAFAGATPLLSAEPARGPDPREEGAPSIGETSPAASVDRDELVHQLAETLGVQEPEPSSSDTPAVAEARPCAPVMGAERETAASEVKLSKDGASVNSLDELAEIAAHPGPPVSLAQLAPAVSHSVVPDSASNAGTPNAGTAVAAADHAVTVTAGK
jgi:hypothetical protein